MSPVQLEHTNLTVSDPHATAAWMGDVFGWHIRWEGASIHNGYSIHVGSPETYLALYAPAKPKPSLENSYATIGGLNHIAVTVDDIDAMEKRVVAAGFKTSNHADYEPGKRFYFHDHDDIEYEIVSYTT